MNKNKAFKFSMPKNFMNKSKDKRAKYLTNRNIIKPFLAKIIPKSAKAAKHKSNPINYKPKVPAELKYQPLLHRL